MQRKKHLQEVQSVISVWEHYVISKEEVCAVISPNISLQRLDGDTLYTNKIEMGNSILSIMFWVGSSREEIRPTAM